MGKITKAVVLCINFGCHFVSLFELHYGSKRQISINIFKLKELHNGNFSCYYWRGFFIYYAFR